METLWRWTSHFVCLVFTLNISCVLSQNVGQNCLLPPLALQGEPLRDCNPGTPQLQMNNLRLLPQNGITPRELIRPVPECQRSPFQDSSCSQNVPFNQQANIVPISPGPCANLSPLNVQALPDPQCAGAIFSPFPQSILPLGEYPIRTPTLSQHSLELPPMEMISQGPLLSFPGMLPTPCPTLLGNHFTPLIPIANPAAPSSCAVVLCPQSMALPSSFFTPGFSGASIDVNPLEPQCASGFNVPINELIQQPNVIPTQGPKLPAAPINYFPQVALGQQCDNLPEAQLCSPIQPCPSSVDPAFQNSSPISLFNKFKFPRPTLFPRIAPFQGPSVSAYDAVISCPNQINPTLIQQEAICTQTPIVPAPCTPNIPLGLPEQNVQLFPAVSSSFCQPTIPFNSIPCSLTTDVAPVSFMPIISQANGPILPNSFGSQISYSVDCPPIAPLVVSQPCNIGVMPPILPNPFNRPCIDENPSLGQSASIDTVPIPINLQINVPAPTIPAPRITIINATPPPAPAVSTTVDKSSYFDMSYPMPPLIVEGQRSRSRSWLPLLLVALFTRDGDFGSCGGSCSCDSGPIPIPFPIPIPTSNPVIINQ